MVPGASLINSAREVGGVVARHRRNGARDKQLLRAICLVVCGLQSGRRWAKASPVYGSGSTLYNRIV